MDNKKLSNSVLVGVAVISLVVAGVFGYLYLTDDAADQQIDEQEQERESAGSEEAEDVPSEEDAGETQNRTEVEQDADNQDEPSEVDCSDYLVIKGDISETEKSQICAKVVEPAMMYYGTLEGEDLIDIVVEPYEDGNDFAYSGSVNTTLYSDGGWLFGYKGESATDIWWHPPCETGAPTPEFTEEFRQEYPKIVEFCGQ